MSGTALFPIAWASACPHGLGQAPSPITGGSSGIIWVGGPHQNPCVPPLHSVVPALGVPGGTYPGYQCPPSTWGASSAPLWRCSSARRCGETEARRLWGRGGSILSAPPVPSARPQRRQRHFLRRGPSSEGSRFPAAAAARTRRWLPGSGRRRTWAPAPSRSCRCSWRCSAARVSGDGGHQGTGPRG